MTVDIHSYWRHGTGKASGAHLDALVDRNEYGMPFVSGKMLKGLLRDAVNRLQDWGRLSDFSGDQPGLSESEFDDSPVPAGSMVRALFGTPGMSESESRPTPRSFSRSGILRVSDARLPVAVERYLSDEPRSGLRKSLFRELHSTAIDHTHLVAKEHSLRSIEVCVPMVLTAEIAQLRQAEEHEMVISAHWPEILKRACHLIPAIGSNRNRGFGRATLSLEEKG